MASAPSVHLWCTAATIGCAHRAAQTLSVCPSPPSSRRCLKTSSSRTRRSSAPCSLWRRFPRLHSSWTLLARCGRQRNAVAWLMGNAGGFHLWSNASKKYVFFGQLLAWCPAMCLGGGGSEGLGSSILTITTDAPLFARRFPLVSTTGPSTQVAVESTPPTDRPRPAGGPDGGGRHPSRGLVPRQA